MFIEKIYKCIFYIIKPILKKYKKKQFDSNYSELLEKQIFNGNYSCVLAKSIHIHASSVGEINSIKSLITNLQLNNNIDIVITTKTKTGYKLAKEFHDKSFLLPLEYEEALKNFNNTFNPIISIFTEVEIWPLAYKIFSKHHPIVLINARLSDKTFKSIKKLKFLQNTINRLSLIITQNENTKNSFELLKINVPIKVGQNLKFVKQYDEDKNLYFNQLKNKLNLNENINIIAGSTHKYEEKFIIEAFQKILIKQPSAKLIIAPRKPQRFQSVYKTLSSNFNVIRLSDVKNNKEFDNNFNIILIDTIGDLIYCYQFAKVSFVGGTIDKNIGGHDIIEAGYYKNSVIIGNYYKKNRHTVQLALQKEAIFITNEKNIINDLYMLYFNKELNNKLSQNMYNLILNNKNAVNIHYQYLKEYL